MSRLIERMATHDDNAEGREIYDRGRVRVAVGWYWLSWQFGGGFDYEPYAADGAWWGPWLAFGPLSVGVVVRRAS